jgi:hypothetical protein
VSVANATVAGAVVNAAPGATAGGVGDGSGVGSGAAVEDATGTLPPPPPHAHSESAAARTSAGRETTNKRDTSRSLAHGGGALLACVATRATARS